METIYLLSDPRTAKPRYVGVTSLRLCERVSSHVQAAKRGVRRPIYFWIRKLLAAGLRPAVTVLEVCEDRRREIYWIARFRAEHPRSMLNMLDGGEGAAGPRSEATRRKLSLAHRGERSGVAKLTEAKVIAMRHQFRNGSTMRHLARAFGMSEASVSRVVRGVDWDHVPGAVSRDEVSLSDCCLRSDRSNQPRGSRSGVARTNEADVAEMRRLAREGWALKRIGQRFGVSAENTNAIVFGRTWLHVPGALVRAGRWSSLDHADTKARGARHARAQLTDELVFEARQRYAAGEQIKAIAEEYGITPQGLGEAISGKTWKHVAMPVKSAA